MKNKTMLFSAVVIVLFAMVGISGCSKKYTCSCTTYSSLGTKYGTDDSSIEADNADDAGIKCGNMSSTNSGGGYTACIVTDVK